MGIIIGHQSNQGIATANAGQAGTYQNTYAFMSQKDINTLNSYQLLAMGAQNLNNAILQQKDDTNDSQQNNEQEIITPQQQENTLAEAQGNERTEEEQANALIEEEQKKKEQTLFAAMKDLSVWKESFLTKKDEYMQTNTMANAQNTKKDMQSLLSQTAKPLLEKWRNNPELFGYVQSNISQTFDQETKEAKAYENQEHEKNKIEVYGQLESDTEKVVTDPQSDLIKKEAALASYRGFMMKLSGDDKESQEKAQKSIRQFEQKAYYTLLETQAKQNPDATLTRLQEDPPFALLRQVTIERAKRIGKEEGVDPNLIMAMIWIESNDKPDAISPKGAIGLMQLMPKTLEGLEKDYKIKGDTEENNIRLGTKYIKERLKEFKGNRYHALLAYNWGPGNVRSYLRTGHGVKTKANPTGKMPKEAKEYSPKIIKKYEANMLQTFSSENTEELHTLTENITTFLSEQFEHKKMSEKAILEKVKAIPFEKVRDSLEEKLEEKLNILSLRRQEEKKNALMAAMNAFKAVINTDVPESEKLANFYTLSREAKKRAKEEKDADSIFYNALQGHLQKHTTFSPYFSKTLKRK